MSIDLEGTMKGITFKPKGAEQNVVATISIECYPNELLSGRLSQLAGKSVDVTISSRQLDLPMKGEG